MNKDEITRPFKKFRSEDELDVVVVVGKKQFRESSAMLQLCSGYFQAAFRSGMKEAATKRFKFPKKKPDGWELIMALQEPFSQTKITKENVDLVLEWSDELCMAMGLEACDGFLYDFIKDRYVRCYGSEERKEFLETHDCLSQSLRYNLPRTKEKCVEIIGKILGQKPTWLTSDDVSKILKHLADDDECREQWWESLQNNFLDAKIVDRTEQDMVLKTGIIQQCIMSKLELLKCTSRR